MNLEELLLKYKEISLEIIIALDKEEIDSLDELLLKRDAIIKEISKTNNNKEELKCLYTKHDLVNIDKAMKEKIQCSLDKVKNDLLKIKKRKEVNKGYSNLNVKSVFLSKRI